MSKRAAETVSRHVQELVRSNEANVCSISGPDHLGLLEHRQTLDITKCKTFFDGYIKGRTDLKAKTRNKYDQAVPWFVKKFGTDRELSSVTPAEFDHWHRWMVSECLANATANKRQADSKALQ